MAHEIYQRLLRSELFITVEKKHLKSRLEVILMLVKVTSDSTCDLSADIIERLDIGIVPLRSLLEKAPLRTEPR